MKRFFIFFCLFPIMFGCRSSAGYERPHVELPPDEGYVDYSVFTQQQWWTIFEEDVLDILQNNALEYNKDLLMAISRVEQALAAVGIASSGASPQVGFSAEGLRQGERQAARAASTFSLGVGASYEIDFWGRRRSRTEAAVARMLATEAERDIVRLTITADIAKTYFYMRSLDAQLIVAENTLKTREERFARHSKNAKKDSLGELDYTRLEAELNTVKADILDIKQQLSASETALSVLSGGTPKTIVQNDIKRGKAIEQINLTPELLSHIPSSILYNRPDIRMAEFMLFEARANIRVARAAYFPSISLTSSVGLESISLASLFSGGLWNFAGRLTGPIFQGWRIRSEVNKMTARQQEMAFNYQAVIQNAFKDAYDAITVKHFSRDASVVFGDKLNALRRSYALAQKQYAAGRITLSDLLDVDRALYDAEILNIIAAQNEINAIIDLCKALGGGFKYIPPAGHIGSSARE